MDSYERNQYRHRPMPHRSATTEERFPHHRRSRGEDSYPRYRTPSPTLEEPSPRDRRRSPQWEDPYRPKTPRAQRSERSHSRDRIRDQRDHRPSPREKMRGPHRRESYPRDRTRSLEREGPYSPDSARHHRRDGRYARVGRRYASDDTDPHAIRRYGHHTHDDIFGEPPTPSTPCPPAHDRKDNAQPEKEEGMLPATIVEPDGTVLWRNPNYQGYHSSWDQYSSRRRSGGRRRTVPNDTDFDEGVRPPRMRRSRTEGSWRP